VEKQRSLLSKAVFFNLFFETEPFAAILIVHGTHGLRQKFVYGEIVKFEAEAGKRSLVREQQAEVIEGLGQRCKFSQRQMHFGCTKSPENTTSGRKCCSVPVSRFNSAEPLNVMGTDRHS